MVNKLLKIFSAPTPSEPERSGGCLTRTDEDTQFSGPRGMAAKCKEGVSDGAKARLGLAVLSLFVFHFSLYVTSCANQLTPQGGPVDSLPPLAVRSTPEIGSRNVPLMRNRVEIEFNEFIQLRDQSKEFFTSPVMKTKPTLILRGRVLRVEIKDTLEANQTYSLNFGNAVRDNNEGNPLSGFRYVFSTGPALDSMLTTGYTVDAARGDSISKAFVFFYETRLDDSPFSADMPDSTLLNYMPQVVGRGEGNGIYIAQNLKDVEYRVYAFEDTNNNLMYDAGVDKVGFLDEPINPANLEPVSIWFDEYRHYPNAEPQSYIRLFGEPAPRRQNLAGTERPGRHQAVLRFAAPFPRIDTLTFEGLDSTQVVREYLTAGRDTIALWFDAPPEALGDTIKGRIAYQRPDSLGVMTSAGQNLRLVWRPEPETREETRERERIEREIRRAEAAGEEYEAPEEPNPFRFRVDASAEVNPEKSIPIEFDLPLAAIDSARISLTAGEEPERFRLVRDTMNIRRWTISADWREDTDYRLVVPEGVFTDIAGERNDSLGANFTIVPRADFATVVMTVEGKTPEAEYVVQIIDGNDQPLKELRHVKTGVYTLYYVPAGEVSIRIIEDGNGNGVWDSGSLVDRRQPERTEYYLGATGDRLIATRENWEMELTVDMAEIFAPVSMEKIRSDLRRAEDARVSKYLEEKAARDAERGQQQQGGGGLGIGGAMGNMRQQMQTTGL